MDGAPSTSNQQQSASPESLVAGLAALLNGVDPSDLLLALESVKAAKEAVQVPDQSRSIYQEKENIYDDESAFIFRRGDTKSRGYYLRIYEDSTRTPYIKGLRTTDRVQAIAKARLIYQEVKGKVARGERIKCITSQELVDKFLDSFEKKITNIPQQGITPDALKLKKYFMRVWLEYIQEIGYKNYTIDRISPEKTREYGYWFLNRPREDGRTGKRSIDQANNAIGCVRQMYRDIAIRDGYISADRMPQIDRLKDQPDDGYKRDILELDQYETLWKFMYYKWIREKGISDVEKATRVIFYNVIGILYNNGQRPVELLKTRVVDITEVDGQTDEIRKTHLKMYVRKENSKTGRARTVIAPIKKRIHRIIEAYESIGIVHEPQDFLLISPRRRDARLPFTRQTLYTRLQEVLEKSGLKSELEKQNKRVSLYSSRHAYITWRLRWGHVPIHLVAKAAGTSVQKIEQTYGHIEIERQTELMTRAQGKLLKLEVSLSDALDNV